MNTLKSTERSLALLGLKRKLAGHVNTKRAYQSKTFDFVNGVKSRRLRCDLQPRIRILKNIIDTANTRLLSTDAQLNLAPLLNPDKPHPDELKDSITKPIVPLSLPRFPKGESSDIPSVTRILSATMPAASKFLLDRWKESMIRKLGAAGFAQYQKDTFQRGTALHTLLASHLLGNGEPKIDEGELPKEVINNLWKSIKNVVQDKINNVRLVEHIVTHKDMKYRGIVDCVAFYENELVVIDFKTAEKPKKTVESLYDNPLQVTAYCAALNNDTSISKDVIDRNIISALVVVAYVDGSEASTYHLSHEQIINNYWKQWQSRLDQYVKLEDVKKNLYKSR